MLIILDLVFQHSVGVSLLFPACVTFHTSSLSSRRLFLIRDRTITAKTHTFLLGIYLRSRLMFQTILVGTFLAPHHPGSTKDLRITSSLVSFLAMPTRWLLIFSCREDEWEANEEDIMTLKEDVVLPSPSVSSPPVVFFTRAEDEYFFYHMSHRLLLCMILDALSLL